MKILLITGKIKSHSCGVCDYTVKLYDSLKKNKQLNITQKYFKDISFLDLKAADLVILNYPCPEFGKSLMLHLKIFIARMIKTKILYVMHEFTYVKLWRKIAILPFIFLANKIVSVTNEQIKKFPRFLTKKMKFIPIASNLDSSFIEMSNSNEKDEFAISYFGVFYPAKKVENIIEAFSVFLGNNDERGNYVLKLIGGVHSAHRNYIEYLKNLISTKNMESKVEWYLNAPDNEVVSLLGETNVCVLPFEEGVTMRRSTFLTAISMKIPTITTNGKDTPLILNECKSILYANNPNEIAERIKEVEVDYSEYVTEASKSKEVLGLKNWDEIGEEYTKWIYS
jgi:glycosyltransferase involved in cell wall biosynthesis